jgi:hypothetical protein
MPRRLRIEFEGAIDHVMARGDARPLVVHDDDDRRRLLDDLARAGWRLKESGDGTRREGRIRVCGRVRCRRRGAISLDEVERIVLGARRNPQRLGTL